VAQAVAAPAPLVIVPRFEDRLVVEEEGKK
jgi:hypothetical protein